MLDNRTKAYSKGGGRGGKNKELTQGKNDGGSWVIWWQKYGDCSSVKILN